MVSLAGQLVPLVHSTLSSEEGRKLCHGTLYRCRSYLKVAAAICCLLACSAHECRPQSLSDGSVIRFKVSSAHLLLAGVGAAGRRVCAVSRAAARWRTSWRQAVTLACAYTPPAAICRCSDLHRTRAFHQHPPHNLKMCCRFAHVPYILAWHGDEDFISMQVLHAGLRSITRCTILSIASFEGVA